MKVTFYEVYAPDQLDSFDGKAAFQTQNEAIEVADGLGGEASVNRVELSGPARSIAVALFDHEYPNEVTRVEARRTFIHKAREAN